MRKINIHCKQRNIERETDKQWQRERDTHTHTKWGLKVYCEMLFVCCLHSPSPCLFPVSLCHLSCFSFISLRLQCARMINERKFHFIFSARYFCFPSPSPPAVRCFLFLCFGLAFCSACLAPVVVVVSRILAAIAAAFFAPPCSLLILLLCAAPLPPPHPPLLFGQRTNNESAPRFAVWLPFSCYCY